jgi:hypothetical protein
MRRTRSFCAILSGQETENDRSYLAVDDVCTLCLVASERFAYVTEERVRNVWVCPKCGYEFETSTRLNEHGALSPELVERFQSSNHMGCSKRPHSVDGRPNKRLSGFMESVV